MRALAVLLTFVLLGDAMARAQDLPPPALDPTSPSEHHAASTGHAWDVDYDKARLLLRDGRFQEAAAALSTLAGHAPDVGRRRLALEQSWLALYWSKRGFQLELVSPEQRSTTGARFHDKRTTDELGWLYTTSVFYGIGSGIALAMVTKPDSPAAAILPTLALSGASAALVYGLDRRPLRYGGAQAITSAFFVGFEQGLVWILWRGEAGGYEDDLSEKQVAGYLWGASTAGAVVGGLVGHLHGITPGRASLIGSGALWSSLVVGLAVSAMTDRSSTALLSAAIALNLGAVGGFVLGERTQPSIGRVRFLDLGVISGGLVAGGLAFALGGEDANERATIGATAAGMLAGFATAWALTGNMTADDPRRAPDFALVPTLMPVQSGGLVGVGGAF